MINESRVQSRWKALAGLTAPAMLACVACLALPAAARAEFGIEKLFAGNCKVESCGEGAEDPSEETAKEQGFLEAGGAVPYGVTDFKLNTIPLGGGVIAPAESAEYLRTDVAAGVVTDPQATSKCSMADFEGSPVEVAGETVYTEPQCPASSEIGFNKVETVVEVAKGVYKDYELTGTVYDLEQPYERPSLFGVALDLEPIFHVSLYAHTLIKGGIEYATDYHDFFEIEKITPGLISSRLVFYGGENGFIRNPSACTKPNSPEVATTLLVRSYGGNTASRTYELPVGTEKCTEEKFEPAFSLTPETPLADRPDGVTATLTNPHPKSATAQDSANLRDAQVVMPEGLTINPSAAAGIEACTRAQFGIGTRGETTCPTRSEIGHVTLEVPTLPEGSLSGPIYLGRPGSGPIEGPPYTLFLDAESARYGVRVRLEGKVEPNPLTGQLTTVFSELPEQPFNEITLHFSGGAFAPLANPLQCGAVNALTAFTPYSSATALSGTSPFTTSGCSSSSPPVGGTQSTSSSPATAGANTDFTFSLQRPEGDQYLEQVRTTLPSGLAGRIPDVQECAEAEANAGSCPAASRIGTITVTAGSGEPYTFTGGAYLTGPYQGAPFGLSFVVPVIAGPFNLGTEVRRAKIEVEPYSARVIVTTTLPTIRAGIPARMRSLSVSVTRQGFMVNPTSCNAEQAESLLSGTLGGQATVPSAFQAEGCSALRFKPTFTASTSGHPTKADGASLVTSLTVPAGDANVKSVFVTLPSQLPSRLSTLNKSCLAATFAANPWACPKGSEVGTATAITPLLPVKMSGHAFYVSHGGEKFPDLDIVLEGDGVRAILVGNTKITKGVTTTNFASTPDVPVTSLTLDLPVGPHSALGAFERLCRPTLYMPTVITAQNGARVTQRTLVSPTGCGVTIVGQRVSGTSAYILVKTFEAGRISVSGAGLRSTYRTLSHASRLTTIEVPLASSSLPSAPQLVRVRVGFTPSARHRRSSQAFTTVTFG